MGKDESIILSSNQLLDNTRSVELTATQKSNNLKPKNLKSTMMLKKARSLMFVATLLLTILAAKRHQSSVILVEAAKTNKNDTSDSKSIFVSLKEQYDELSPRGKVVTGAAVGFVGSRLALGTVTKVVKWGAGAFIVAEALKMTGIMDDLPSLSDEQNDMITIMKGRVLQSTENFRVKIRESLTHDKIQEFFDKERMCAFGVAGGVVAGAIL